MKPAVALLLATCLATVCAALPLSAVSAHLTAHAAWLSLAAGVIGAAIYWLRTPSSGTPLKMRGMDWIATLLFALLALRAFCWLVFYDGDSLKVLSPNNLGDLSLHLTYIRYLAKGPVFWPQNPIYSGIPLHYPAGIDIFNALLKLAGCDDFRALIWVGLIGSALTCYALLRWGRWFAVLGFLCNSGLSGWKFFHHYAFHFQDYQQDVAWKSIPLSMFVTQRGLLYAIPTGLLLITAWRAQWWRESADEQNEHPSVTMPQWVQAILYGTMPLFHLHTFIFLSAVLGWWLAWGRKGSRIRHEVIDLLLWAVLPATICVSLVTGLFQNGQSAAAVVHITVGWLQEKNPFFLFWFENFGILPIAVLTLLGWIFQPVVQSSQGSASAPSPAAATPNANALPSRKAKKSSKKTAPQKPARPPLLDPPRQAAAAFVLPAILLFLTCCFVMFAPWEWDNMKLMIWCYLAILPFLHELLLRVPGPVGLTTRIVYYALLFFSGFVSLIGGLDGSHTGFEIAKRSELDAVEFSTRFLPPDATFAGYPTYNHPLLLSGCKMTEGYEGHLYSHGIDYLPRQHQLKDLFDGAADWRSIASTLKVRYIYFGTRESAAVQEDSPDPWKTLPIAASGPWGQIYDLGPDLPIPNQVFGGHK